MNKQKWKWPHLSCLETSDDNKKNSVEKNDGPQMIYYDVYKMTNIINSIMH